MNAPITTGVGQALGRGFRLEALRIDAATGEVSGPAGRQVLDPKVMGVLVFLAERAGRLVSREDLHEHIWPSAIVTDDALTRCIHELRRQLSLAGGDDRYHAMIETLPKRGYRLNGEATPLEATPLEAPVAVAASSRPSRTWRWVAAAVAVLALLLLGLLRRDVDLVAPPAARTSSIAVLPFLDLSEAQDQGYFADGMAEEILNYLTKSSGLRVISRTSSFAFRGQATDIRQVAEKLGVTHLLEGSVRRAGDRVRITAQLISAADGSHAWSETYDRGVDEMFAVQDEIAKAVTTALRIKLVVNPSATDAPNPEAYNLYLQARFFYNRRAAGDIARAAAYFEQSVAIDPSFAVAWSALAGTYALMLNEDDDGDEGRLRPLQGEAAMKAVELQPGLAVARARLSQYYYGVGELEKGDDEFAEAVALDSNDPLVMGFASGVALGRGDVEGAVEIWRELVARNPLSPTDRINLAHHLLLAGQSEEAISQYRKATELNPNLKWQARIDALRALILARRFDEALAEIPQLPAGLPRDYVLAAAPGHAPESDAALDRLVAAGTEADRVLLAETFALRGMTREAFATLTTAKRVVEESVAAQPSRKARLWSFCMQLRQSAFLKSLHPDPRWQVLIAESK